MSLAGEFRRRRRVVGVGLAHALLVALALPCLAFAAGRDQAAGVRDGCANAKVSASSASPQAMRGAVVCLVNRERARYHLPPLIQDSKLTLAAQRYTSEMVRGHFFSHTGPRGSTPGSRITAAGYLWSWMSENIARVYPTPVAVVSAWMQSREHCRNILAPVFRNLGVGVVAGNNMSPIWTQDFGLPRGERPPSGNWGPARSCPR